MVIINKETNKSYSLNPNNKIAFDGCHKIYICESDEDLKEAKEYGYKEKLKIVYDEDFKRPDLVISNQQFSYNNKLYQLLVIDQPMY